MFTAWLSLLLFLLRHEFKCIAPILLVVPAGLMDQWEGEASFWSAGALEVTLLHGSATARSILIDNEIWQATDSMDGKMPSYLQKRVRTVSIWMPPVVLKYLESA